MAELNQEMIRVIEFFVRDNISRVVEQIFDAGNTITTLRSWLETQAAGSVMDEKKRRIAELADELQLADETNLGDIRVEVDGERVSE